jgi:hypothetical protein
MLDSLIVQDGPQDSTNPGSAVGAIETFDANVGSGRRLDEVVKAVGDTSCSSPLSKESESKSCGMVAGSGPLAPREGSRSRTERSSTRAATAKISGLDMDVGCYEDSKVVKGGVGQLEPRLEPLRTSRELALGNIGIGQGVRNISDEDPEHSLGIELDGGKVLGP